MSLHSRPLRVCLTFAICALAWTIAAAEPAPPAVRSPLSPEDAVAQFVLPPGLKIEIVACEPQLVDPVAMRFDEQGRLWVAEMRDYPDPPGPGELPKSQIKLLEDRDGDGRFETMHVFADHLLFATGIQPWQGGVLATISGRIVYLKDTDGDNKADVEQPWFTGFAEKNPQLRVNHPRFALDNRIYAAGGLQGGDVQSNFHPTSPAISLRNKDIRFNPRDETAEAIAGNGQFCMTFDDFGRRFLCSNRHPLMHVVLEDRYLLHNPSLLPALGRMEAHVSSLSMYCISVHRVAAVEKNLQNGDIICIVSKDVPPFVSTSHVGLATRDTNGILHFMHASSPRNFGKVVIDDELSRYLRRYTTDVGIMVVRPLK